MGRISPAEISWRVRYWCCVSRGAEWSDLGVDYRIEFYDASKAVSGTSGDDDLSCW